MGKLKRIYAHTKLKDRYLFGEDEVKQREDKELMCETSFWYDENTRFIYYATNTSDAPALFKSLLGQNYRFVDNEIRLSD